MNTVAIFDSLHPNFIISATRSPQCADGTVQGLCGCMNFRIVTWFITECPDPSKTPPQSLPAPCPSLLDAEVQPTELWLNLELQFGDFEGEGKAGRTMRCLGHEEFWVAALE